MIYLILFLGFLIRIFRLNSLPGEMWGDVIEHFRMTEQLLDKKFFYNYQFGGDGPLFDYLTLIISKIFGLSFWSIKLTSVIIGTFIIYVNYLITQLLFKNKKIAYFAAFLTAIGFWGITFSRQGKPYILAGFFISLAIYFLLKKRYWFLGLVIGLGIYSQSSFWGIYFLSFINIKSFLLTNIISLPLFLDYFKNSINILSENSYLGEKLVGSYNLGLLNYILGILFNYGRNLTALFYNGDRVFRHNIPNYPHLDFIMQIFLLIGFYFFIKKFFLKNIKKYFWIIIFIFLIYLPTCLDVKNYLNNPSMGRTVGAVSIFYPLVSLGIFEIYKRISKKTIIKDFFLGTTLFFIFFLNFYNYFFLYPKTLPQENFPLSKLTAEELDKYDENIPLFIKDCCWFAWGMPEPYSIIFSLNKKRSYILNDKSKEEIISFINNNKKFLVIVNPSNFSFENFKLRENYQIKEIKYIKKIDENMLLIVLFERFNNDLL